MSRSTEKYEDSPLVPAAVSVLVWLILFYLDEGFNSFAWMRDPGAWVVFVLYSGILFTLQCLMVYLLQLIRMPRYRLLVGCFLGLLVCSIPLWT